MRVTFVDQSGDAIGGAEESLAQLLAHLPADIEPHALLFGDGAFSRRLRELGIPTTSLHLPRAFMEATRERPAAPGAAFLPVAAFEVTKALRAARPDIVYTNTVKAHLLGGIGARAIGVRGVAHLRDILRGTGRTILRNVLRATTVRRIAISNAVARNCSLARTHVIANPLALAAYETLPAKAEARRSLGLEEGGQLVTIVGRINRWKGHDRFLRIAAAVAEQLPHNDVRFAIVGAAVFRDEDFAVELRGLAERLGIAGRVRFVPWLDDPRLAYAASDVLCNCSSEEPFGRTLMEAQASGRPVICFSDGGASEALVPGETGYVIAAGDEAAFARALSALLGDGDRLERFGEAARHSARRFDAVLHATQVAAVLRPLHSR